MALRKLQKGNLLQKPAKQMGAKQVPNSRHAPHISMLLCRPSHRSLAGVGAALHARGEGAVAAEVPRHKTRCRGARLNDTTDRPGGERLAAERGQGASGLTCGGSQMRRNPGPSVNGAACSPSESARARQSSERP